MVRPFVRHISERNDSMMKGEDLGCLSKFQTECLSVFSTYTLNGNESYLMSNPTITLMVKMGIARLLGKPQFRLQDLGHFYQQSDEELREILKTSLGESKFADMEAEAKARRDKEQQNLYLEHLELLTTLNNIIKQFPAPSLQKTISSSASSVTTSSTFLSIPTSPTTLSTPEPEPEPVVTISQIFYNMISATVNKATMLKISEDAIKYDIAYVELMKIVEIVMEMAVEEIKEDIRELYAHAYQDFEKIIIDKQEKADAIAWENRMRKKLKRLLRRQKNFRGYETPPSTKSTISEHPSYKLSPQQICRCHPTWKFNRYPKDRFGLYLPPEIQYQKESITVPISTDEPPVVNAA